MSERRAGYFRLLTVRGVPLFIHWSLPVGGLLISAIAGFDLYAAPFYCLGYVLLIAVHEGGHVAAAWLLGIKVRAVEISGAGGLCQMDRPRRVRHSVLVYSAGLLAQVGLFLLTCLYIAAFGLSESPLGESLFVSFTVVNAILLIINLIPQKTSRGGTDGYVLWKLFLHVFRNHPHPHPYLIITPVAQSPVFPPETRLLSMPDLVPKGFTHGIEILNDRTTPMELVVTALVRHLKLERQEAVTNMVYVHNNGGLLIPLPTMERAMQAAAAIESEAREQGHGLICRAVDARLLVPR